jgi:ribosomal protein S18 acetylase RimI-like enzyme
MTDGDHPLDNAVWHALRGPHAEFALVRESARRYRPDVSVFGAVEALHDAGWAGLEALAGPGGEIILFRVGAPTPPDGWDILGGGTGHQLVLDRHPKTTSSHDGIRELGHGDVAAMLALVERSRPGPFVERTVELGGYLGRFDEGRLVAMAGRRLALPGYVEISAVTTDPDARGRGYASLLTTLVAQGIQAEGSTPFLHVADHNVAAKRLYEQLGFVERALVSFTLLRAPAGPR